MARPTAFIPIWPDSPRRLLQARPAPDPRFRRRFRRPRETSAFRRSGWPCGGCSPAGRPQRPGGPCCLTQPPPPSPPSCCDAGDGHRLPTHPDGPPARREVSPSSTRVDPQPPSEAPTEVSSESSRRRRASALRALMGTRKERVASGASGWRPGWRPALLQGRQGCLPPPHRDFQNFVIYTLISNVYQDPNKSSIQPLGI